MKKHRSAYYFIFIGIFFITTAVALQIKFSEKDLQLKPIDSKTAQELYNPQQNSAGGNPNGKITMVEFLDYNCSDCRDVYPKIKKLAAKNPDLRIIYKESLLFGTPSLPPTYAALAAQNQGKYTELQNAFITATQPLTQKEILNIAGKIGLNVEKLKTDMNSAKVQEQAKINTELAKKLGIDGVPTFIVTSSELAQDPEKKGVAQYLFKGTDQIEKNLQHLIDNVKRDIS